MELWIDVGQPEEKLVRRAAHRAQEVVVLSFGRQAPVWWAQNRSLLERLPHLRVLHVRPASIEALAALVERTLRLQCTIQDGQVWLGHERQTVEVEIEEWKAPR